VILENPELPPRIRVLEAQLRLLETRAQAERVTDRVRWDITREEIAATRAELEHVRRLNRDLVVRSATSGMFVLSLPLQDLPGRYVRKGQQLGYVVPASTVTARVLVSQDDVDLVRSGTEQVNVKLAGRMHETYEARIVREAPAAIDRVANLALSSVGGGPAPLDPQRADESMTLDTWFEFELELPATRDFALGRHVYVRFEHVAEPLAWRLYRSVRQVFLRQFLV
jgi:putative peptide zinc metalloprotease protein